MTNLSDISIDKIETDIMSVLYANIDKKFTHYALFDELLKNKYDCQYTNFIHPNFKSKFLLILKTIMSKYDDIYIEKKDDKYIIMCKSDDFNDKKQIFIENNKIPVSFEKVDILNMYDYIYENNLEEYMNISDPFDGNSIYHELILNDNVKITSKLINENKFNFEIKNNNNQTPIDLINSIQMSNLIINIFKKKYEQEKNNVSILFDKLKSKIEYYESEFHIECVIKNTSFNEFIKKKIILNNDLIKSLRKTIAIFVFMIFIIVLNI